MNWKRYYKLIAAAVGILAILFGPDFLGMTGDPEELTEKILAVLALVGIWASPKNEDAPTAKSNSAKSPAIVGILALFLAVAMMAGCAWSGVQRPAIHSTSDAIVVTAADIESVSDQVREACGNTEPGGQCVPGSLISTSQKASWKDRLQEAQNSLVLANRALAVADNSTADTRLAAAESILRIVRAELAQRVQ